MERPLREHLELSLRSLRDTRKQAQYLKSDTVEELYTLCGVYSTLMVLCHAVPEKELEQHYLSAATMHSKIQLKLLHQLDKTDA